MKELFLALTVVTMMSLGRLDDGCLTMTGVNLFVINQDTNQYYLRYLRTLTLKYGRTYFLFRIVA